MDGLIFDSVLINRPFEANTEDRSRRHLITNRVAYHKFQDVYEFKL